VRRIAIIGSGIAGLTLAHALRREGHGVSLYSDRTPEQWLDESRPTGTAARFDDALSFERELGLNHWDDVAPRGEGVFVTFCPKLRNPLVRLYGRILSRPSTCVCSARAGSATSKIIASSLSASTASMASRPNTS
jgi:glycine/D-amino acid oxidase-like deaminating enzyme